MTGEDSAKNKLAKWLDIEPSSLSTDSVTIGAGTSFNSAHIKADAIEWLVANIHENGEMHADEVRLHTSEGEFVFTAEDNTVVVRHKSK